MNLKKSKALALPFFSTGFTSSSSELSSSELDSCFLTSAFCIFAGVPRAREHSTVIKKPSNSAFGPSKMTYGCLSIIYSLFLVDKFTDNKTV